MTAPGQFGPTIPLRAAPSEQQWEIIKLDQQFLNFAHFDPDVVTVGAASDPKADAAKVYEKKDLLTKTIHLKQIDFWFKQAGVISKDLTRTDTGLAYCKFQVKGILFADFLAMLDDLAATKELAVEDIKIQLQSCGLPGASKTAKAKGN
ncbi:tubulin polymerization-promoting protein homolog [Diabrotica undecimpunctata]|uniref:tubulin polymerization-promoting protein homolog n=1 Tax=Diabrotica undecimpunctata TaxID=50387 RepID=UPI003B63F1BD